MLVGRTSTGWEKARTCSVSSSAVPPFTITGTSTPAWMTSFPAPVSTITDRNRAQRPAHRDDVVATQRRDVEVLEHRERQAQRPDVRREGDEAARIVHGDLFGGGAPVELEDVHSGPAGHGGVVAVAAVPDQHVVAGAAADAVGASVAAEPIVALIAGELVVARVAHQDIVSGVPAEDVVAVAARHDVVAAAAEDAVVAVAAEKDVVADAAEDEVGAIAAIDDQRGERQHSGQRVEVVVALQHVDVEALGGADAKGDARGGFRQQGALAAGCENEHLRSPTGRALPACRCRTRRRWCRCHRREGRPNLGPPHEAVVAGAAEHDVVADAGLDGVVAGAAADRVVAPATREDVVAVTTVDGHGLVDRGQDVVDHDDQLVVAAAGIHPNRRERAAREGPDQRRPTADLDALIVGGEPQVDHVGGGVADDAQLVGDDGRRDRRVRLGGRAKERSCEQNRESGGGGGAAMAGPCRHAQDDGDPASMLPGRYGRRVARAFVPAAQVWPRASEYIARSTLMPTPFVTSIKAPKPSFCSSGAALLTSTLKREVGATVKVFTTVEPFGAQERDLDVRRGRARVRQQDVGLESLGHADAAFGQAPPRGQGGRAEAVVGFGPRRGRPGPVHRALRDHRLIRRDRRRDGGVGEQRVLVLRRSPSGGRWPARSWSA